MNDILTQLGFLMDALIKNSYYAILFVGIFILVHIVNFLLGYRLNIFGIWPRRKRGLIGIPLHSFLHGDFNHLFFNMVPLFILSAFLLVNGLDFFIRATVYIILISGILIWLFGRRAIHIGASSLVMGYMGIVLADAYWNPNLGTVLILIISLYYLGGILFSIFPTKEKVSWEGHLFGLIAGLITVYLQSLHVIAL